MRASLAESAEQLLHERRNTRELTLIDDDRATPAREVLRIRRLVIGGGVRIGNEDGRRSGGRELPDRPARTRDREVGRRESGAEPVGRGDEHIVVSMHAAGARPRSRAPPKRAEPQDPARRTTRRRTRSAPAPRRAHRTRRAPELSGGSPKSARPSAFPAPRCAAGIGRPTTRYLRPSRPGIAVGEEDATRKRRCEAIREPEVCVGLRERSRNAPQPRRQHHGACDVASTAEHDVGSPLRKDSAAREGRSNRLRERSYQAEPDAPRKSRDRERVELEARLRNELRLDAVGRPGERHCHSARAQRFRDCESGPDVTGCPSRRDHAPKLRRPFH